MLRFAHALDDLAAATRRRPSPGERQYPVQPLGDDRLVQKDFDPRRADRNALDRVSHILLVRRVRSQTVSLFVLRDRLVAAEDAVVDVIVRDRACLNRRMRPDCARNPVFDLRGGNADDRSGVLPASCQRRTRHIVSPAPPALGGMARTHPMSAIIIELGGQKRMVIRPGFPPCLRLALEPLVVNSVPHVSGSMIAE